MRKPILAIVLFALTTALAAERPDPQRPVGGNLKTPPGWKVRPDTPQPDLVVGSEKETADVWFVNMTPGWHITTGPRVILWHPESTGEGEYWANAVIHLFDPGERNEAFGLFFGGRDLTGDAVAYEYFLIRNSGEYLIKRRRGAETEVIRDWTKHPGIVRYTDPSVSSVENRLEVVVGTESVGFRINDETVATVPKGELETDGVVGLRVNHRLNLHVSELRLE